jgi:ketosteroid isomerase-like protein
MVRLRILVSLLLLVWLSPGPAMAASGGVGRVRAFLAAMAAKDRPAVAAMLDQAAVFEYPFDRSGRTEDGAWRRFDGRDAVLTGYVDNAFARIAKIAWTNERFTASADGQVVFVEARGDMRLASGATYRNLYVLRFQLRKGRISGLREYMNPVTAALAAGVPTGPTK